MKYLWKFVNKVCQENTVTAMFLASNILLFTIFPMVLGVLFCIITMHLPIMEYLSDIILVSIYVGIIVGLFGGILYLMRKKV